MENPVARGQHRELSALFEQAFRRTSRTGSAELTSIPAVKPLAQENTERVLTILARFGFVVEIEKAEKAGAPFFAFAWIVRALPSRISWGLS